MIDYEEELKKFDLYFGYSFGKGMKFKYDIYTRTEKSAGTCLF